MKLKSKSQWFVVIMFNVNAGNSLSSMGKLLDWKMRLQIALSAAQGDTNKTLFLIRVYIHLLEA
jgi:hypothetical protein